MRLSGFSQTSVQVYELTVVTSTIPSPSSIGLRYVRLSNQDKPPRMSGKRSSRSFEADTLAVHRNGSGHDLSEASYEAADISSSGESLALWSCLGTVIPKRTLG